MKSVNLIIFFILIFLKTNAQNSKIDSTNVKWLTLKQIKQNFTQRQKPIMLYLYDKENDSSQMMLDSIFSDKTVISYLNILFYNGKIERHSQKELTFFNDSIFKPKLNLSTHPLINYLEGNKPYFPSYVFFQTNGKGEVYTGYYDSNHFLPLLIYYAEAAYKTVDYPSYLKYFRKVYPVKSSTGYSIVHSVAKWTTLPEALKKQKENPKKILIDFYLNEKNLSTIQYMQTYNNRIIGNYMNEHFYNVHLNGTSQDTIKAFGGIYIPNSPKPFHQLVVAMLAGKMYFPSLMILDENGKMLDRIQAYLPPEKLEPILHFYAENAYKKMNFKQYKKKFKSISKF